MRRFDRTVAVVTGASSGIGRRLAIDLAVRGATVIGLARRAGALEETARVMHQTSPASEALRCDVSDIEGFTAELADVERRHGRIDVLVNDAGIEEPTPVTTGGAGLEPYRRIFATNFFALVAGTLAVLPGMLARSSGTIVNVSSDAARDPARARTRRARPR
jgi:NADP-dependent 3-hydroxy acid dehydrogenase YdfG